MALAQAYIEALSRSSPKNIFSGRFDMVRGLLLLAMLFFTSIGFAELKVKERVSASIKFSELYSISGVTQSTRSSDVALFLQEFLRKDSPAFNVIDAQTESVTLDQATESLSKAQDLFKPLTPEELEKVRKFTQMNEAQVYQVYLTTMTPPGMTGKTNYFLFVSKTKTLVLVIEQLLYNE